jgi:SpoIIAA-like
MPIGFYIYLDSRLLFIRGHGVITQTERIETILAWLRDPDYQDCTDALFDVTAAQSTPRLAELRQIMSILRQHMPSRGPKKLAIVTARPITYAVARVFQELMQPRDIPLQVKVFINREAAWTWLRPGQPRPEPR